MNKHHPGRLKFLLGWGLVFAAAISCVLLVACSKRGASAPVAIDSYLSPQPARVGPITVTVKLRDSATGPVSGAHVTLEGDMSHPGMGPVFGEAREVAPGRYQGELQLPMAGDWVVLSHVILADGQKLEHQMNVSGVQPN